MKYAYSLTQPFIICFLLISIVLQSCGTPPNSPPAKQEKPIPHLPISIGEVTDKQLLPEDSPLSITPQLQATETKEEQASQGMQALTDLAAAQGAKQDKVYKIGKGYYPKVEAGEQQIALATYKMARLYEGGKDREDLELALALYSKASKLGYQKAAYHAGRLHLFGRTPKSNIREAYGLLEKAGQGGIYKACLLLGQVHEYGWGTVPNSIEALMWYAQAASSLNKDSYSRGSALYRLGWLYKLGKGVVCNEATALSFFEQALIIGRDIPINQASGQAASIYDQQVESRVRKQIQEQIVQILTEISHNGEKLL
jgi:TPR repeat protein